MLRRTVAKSYKIPKNMGVAPRYDTWNEKYEPWEHMRRMGRLVGTGFYIPPEWYNHFRMFPPLQHNFQQEKTLNPQNDSEPTQSDQSIMTAERIAVREELAGRSRLLASEGMRYYNIFWIRKPLDRMEKQYYDLKRQGVPHETAIKRVLQSFYEELTVKKRVSAIQAEEAKLSGKFITMREATVVMQVLAQVHRERLTPHQVGQLTKEQRATAQGGDGLQVHVTSEVAKKEDSEAAGTVSADSLADFLADADDGSSTPMSYKTEVSEAAYDSVPQLRETAADHAGYDWYGGETPLFDVSAAPTTTEASPKSTTTTTSTNNNKNNNSNSASSTKGAPTAAADKSQGSPAPTRGNNNNNNNREGGRGSRGVLRDTNRNNRNDRSGGRRR